VLHQRTPINHHDLKPLRFVDSSQNYFMQKNEEDGNAQSNQKLQPQAQTFQNRAGQRNGMGRPRRSSNGSSDEEVIHEG